MIKLYEIAAALSVKLGILKLLRKNSNTSYNGMPSKPEGLQCLLLCIKKYPGGVLNILRSSLFKPVDVGSKKSCNIKLQLNLSYRVLIR